MKAVVLYNRGLGRDSERFKRTCDSRRKRSVCGVLVSLPSMGLSISKVGRLGRVVKRDAG